jgi:4-amino-4-deoxy-L-arabinose transferase-like glycosyltransferase
MPDSYTPTEDSQEPLQVASSVLPDREVSATQSLGSLADFSSLFDVEDKLSLKHLYPNFFVVAPPHPGEQHPISDAAQEEEHQEERKTATQALLTIPETPLPEFFFDTDPVTVTIIPTTPVTIQKKVIVASIQNRLQGIKAIFVRARLAFWLETTLVTIGLLAALATHAINMFNFPRYELDEGTYMSSAWAIMNGMITPYPYGYGHPPLGWIQIAAWVQLTGGFFIFGNAINSGRVLMLLYALGCSLLVYLIARRITGSSIIGLFALALFSLSPLSIIYQRQVFLDNIGTFWLLLSLYLMIASNSRLPYIVCSGISLGIALLSKETFVICLPAMIYVSWLCTTRYQRKFALVTFVYAITALGSTFILMAVLKGELFPYAWHLPWDHHEHLSLLDTLVSQVQRTQSEGSLADSWYTWTHADPLLMALSIVTVGINLVAGWWNRKQLALALLTLSYWLLIARGGVVLSFYIIPIVPLAVLNTAMVVNMLRVSIKKLLRLSLIPAILIIGAVAVIMPYDMQYATMAFTQHPTSAQTDAMVWVRNNVPHNDMVVINSYLYMDLREPGGEGVGNGATYPNAQVYWNVAYDPELYTGLLQGNWDRIDYIVADSEMLHDITTVGGPMDLINNALQHSILRAEFRANDHDKQIVITIYQVIHKQPPRTV